MVFQLRGASAGFSSGVPPLRRHLGQLLVLAKIARSKTDTCGQILSLQTASLLCAYFAGGSILLLNLTNQPCFPRSLTRHGISTFPRTVSRGKLPQHSIPTHATLLSRNLLLLQNNIYILFLTRWYAVTIIAQVCRPTVGVSLQVHCRTGCHNGVLCGMWLTWPYAPRTLHLFCVLSF